MFGGNLVACAAALATIDELQNGIFDNAREQGQWLPSELEALEGYGVVGQTCGLGLMCGVELVEPGTTRPQNVAPALNGTLASDVSDYLRNESNVVMGVGGYYKNVMRFQPPLTTRETSSSAPSTNSGQHWTRSPEGRVRPVSRAIRDTIEAVIAVVVAQKRPNYYEFGPTA